MGKSTSCFKIITCGSDSVDQDDLQASEEKGSSDKRGWSFRKRSARHRVLSNTVITETPPSGNKESPESAEINFQSAANTSVPEKISLLQWPDEKPELSTSVDSNVTETAVAIENESKVDVTVEESLVIAIQTAVRGLLAQKEYLRLKNVVKLQAAVRGHLVRRHAVGTLRCVQAIVKMQALVRARQRSYTDDKSNKMSEKDNLGSKSLENDVLDTKPTVVYTSIEKLLSNRFARQLLESTPRTKTIHIKCDSSRPNSAWIWLERWMSVSSPDLAESQKPELRTEEKESEKVEVSTLQVKANTSLEVCESADSKPATREAAVPVDSENELIINEADNFDFQKSLPTSSYVKDNMEQPQPEKIDEADAAESTLENDSLQNRTVSSDAKYEPEFNSFPGKPEIDSEKPRRSVKRFASEQLDSEGNKFVYGSKKASNPAFVAAQSKFEELSSTFNTGIRVDSNIDKVLSGTNTAIGISEPEIAGNSVPHDSIVQVGGSECGTELSITSTLDSPDRSDTGALEFDHEAKVLEGGDYIPSKTKDLDVEANNVPTISVTGLSDSVLVQPDKLDTFNSVVAVDSSPLEQKPERSVSDLQIEVESETGHKAYRSSPEASPRSHITVPESQGTPSSQLSTKAKHGKTDKSGSSKKRTSLSADKRSPSSVLHDSGARNSVEHLPKDQKSGKRRNSFGPAKPDQVDQERRDSSGSNSLPSYMQATESARAKIQANNSPRSSPDVLDKDIYMKKRHSLPGANGTEGSPPIQRPISQAQQNAKKNSTHPQEKRWQR